MNFLLPDNVNYILSKLENSGYRADIVGGPVRDFLLGKTPDDFDITTSASPDETKRIFSDRRFTVIFGGVCFIHPAKIFLLPGGQNGSIS